MAIPEQAVKADFPSLGKILSQTLFDMIFPPHLTVVPQLNEFYELELAFFESKILSDGEIIRNAAYFASVGGKPTRHFLMCSGEPLKLAEHSSSRLKSFFQNNQFKTGYATHGLFPYRGKFHPQMIKGLINIMGLKPGDTVLDPMMGSGTVLIEATLMGINSVGVDASPFCRFMTQAKLDGLRIPLSPIKEALDNFDSVFKYFTKKAGVVKKHKVENCRVSIFAKEMEKREVKAALPKGCRQEQVRNYLMLAFLDAMGYSQRSQKKSLYEQFKAILERYYFVAKKIQTVLEGVEQDLAEAKSLEGDARNLPLDNNSIDGIIFSPPYSFAIDYLANDAFHLKTLGVSIPTLKESMVGLRGKNMREKYHLYVQDIGQVLAECARVLKPGKICSIVVGTNNNQLSHILKVPREKVKGIDQILVELGRPFGLNLVRRIERQITGMANTMRTEFIVMLQKN